MTAQPKQYTRRQKDTPEPADLSAYVFGKLQPQALPLEEAVLGALMIDRDAFPMVCDILRPEHFYTEPHQAIYSACLSLFSQSEPIDILAVAEKMKTAGTLEKAGGSYYLVELTSRVASAANIEYHALILKQKWVARELIRVATLAVRDGYDEQKDPFDLLDGMQGQLYDISNNAAPGASQTAEALAAKVVRDILNARDSDTHLTGITTGFSGIDRQTGGLQRTDLIILAARPGMGKTSLAINFAVNTARAGNKVMVFSLEMSAEQLMQRIISPEVSLTIKRMRSGNITDADESNLVRVAKEVGALPITIDDEAGISVNDLRARAKRQKVRHGLDLIVVDYLQKMRGSKNTGNREQEINEIAQGLKNLAKELDVPVIALSQLSRAVESRGGSKRPQMSDLRESGAIEQEADIVAFLYRPEYYDIKEDETGKSTAGVAELDIAKFRNGQPGVVMLHFEGEFTRFTDPQSPGMFPTSPQPISDYAATQIANRNRQEPAEDVPF